MLSMLHDICENSATCAILTCISSPVRHMRTTNRSSFSGRFTVHGNDRVDKLSVIYGHASQVFCADFFPRLVK